MPAYNEEENLPEAVQQAVDPLASIDAAWEIVLVNDASTDDTARVAEALAGQYPGQVHVVHHPTNQGLGGALCSGFGAAQGTVFAYCDADLPFDMTVLQKAYAILERDEADVVVGHRLKREEGWRRALYTAVYNRLVNTLFDLDVRDVNCPLKVFRRAVFDREGLHSTGSFIDAELLARAHRNGFRIAELGVAYTPRTRGISTLSRPSVIVGILRELLQYRR
ncbi:MAG: glycosyltransferase family 2 protein, partial [Rhodothermaceae bacterium]|nr:glycosyltransferase family 2 protein [Rhodothermaceae bacterium]